MGTIYKISSKNYDEMTQGNWYYYANFSPTGGATADNSDGVLFEGKTFEQVIDSTEIIGNDFVLHLKNDCYIYGTLWKWDNITNITEVKVGDLLFKYLKFGDEVYNIIERGIFYNPNEIKKIGEQDIITGTIFNDYIDLSGARPAPHAGKITINSYEGYDYIVGSAYDDIIDAGSGDDEIYAGKGDDIITGGTGDDYIVGGKGHNIIKYEITDGYDVIKMTNNEDLTIDVGAGIAYDDLSFELNGDDLIISRKEIEGTGDDAETTLIPIMRLIDFGKNFSAGGDGPSTTNPNTPFGGYVLPASSSSSLTTHDKDYAPPIAARIGTQVPVSGVYEYKDLITEIIYDIEATQNYKGTWHDERIDASNASSGVTIFGKGGDDIIIGSEHDDIINGGAGDNTIIYDKQDFGNDTIYQNLNNNSNLTVDLSALPVGNYGEHGQAGFIYEVVGKDLKVTYLYYLLDDDGNRVKDENENDIIETSSITFAELYSKKVVADDGKVYIKYGPDEDDKFEAKRDAIFEMININKNYNGTLRGDWVNASGLEHAKNEAKNTGLTISTGYGNDIVTGSYFNDVIKTGAHNDTIFGTKGNDKITGGKGENTIIYGEEFTYGNNQISDNFDTDTVKLTKGEKLTIDLTHIPHVIDNISFDKNGKNLIIDTGKGNIILANFAASDVTGVNGGVKILYEEGELDLKNDIWLDKINISKNFNGTYLSEEIDASGLQNPLNPAKNTGVVINSKAGNDKITGSNYNDTIKAGDGNDEITAGRGNDILYGGKGADTFIFSGSFDSDIIKDIDIYDKINITDVTKEDLRYIKQGNNLEIRDALNGNNKIIVQNYFKKDAAIASITASDGDVDLNSIVYQVSGSGKIYGSKYKDNIVGSAGKDVIYTNGADDSVNAQGGNDTIHVNGSGTKNITIGKNDGNDTIDIALKNVELSSQNKSTVNLVLSNTDEISNISYHNAGKSNLAIEIQYGTGNDAITQKILIKNMRVYEGSYFKLKINGSDWQNVINNFGPNPAPPINPAPAYGENYDDINSAVSSWLSNGASTDAGLIPDEVQNDDLSNLILAQVTA